MQDYIGVKYCGFAPSDSGEYINSYPGIEFAQIDEIADADQQSWAGVWADIQQRAIKRFRLDVIGRISGFDKRYKLRQITQTVDLGKDLGDTISAGAYQRGLVIELMNPGEQCVCSNMQSIYVQSIQFYCINAGAYVLKVVDADSMQVIDTFMVTGVQGWNVTKCDKEYDDVRRLAITVNTTAIDTKTLDLSNFNLQLYTNSNWCSNCYSWTGSALWFDGDCTGTSQVRGYQSDSGFGNVIYGSNTFGVSCVYSLKCTYNNVVCKNKRFFSNAWGLALCIELMTERIYSSRINRWTTVDLKRAYELRNEFEVQYRGGVMKTPGGQIEYEGELKKACESIDLDLSDSCLQTDGAIEWRETQM